MSTRIRPETSKKTEYWIPKHRYYELKHFVMQYPEWVKAVKEGETSLVRPSVSVDKVQNGAINDPTGEVAERCLLYSHNIDIVNNAAEDTDAKLGSIIMNNVINEIPFKPWSDAAMLVSKDRYYDLYRKFFWLLDKYREGNYGRR